eukprot:4115273-Pleurochrysis_carterae.AAC.1
MAPRAACPAGAPSSSRMRRARRMTSAAPLAASVSAISRIAARQARPASFTRCRPGSSSVSGVARAADAASARATARTP